MSGLEELKRYAESQAATQNNYGIAELIMEAVKDAERYRLMRKLTLENIEDTEEEFDAVFDLQTQVKP